MCSPMSILMAAENVTFMCVESGEGHEGIRIPLSGKI